MPPPGILDAVDLKSPATTVALLKMNAVVGLQATVDSNNHITRLGVTCALCLRRRAWSNQTPPDAPPQDSLQTHASAGRQCNHDLVSEIAEERRSLSEP